MVGTFPSQGSLLRFVTPLLMDIDDDRSIGTNFLPERSMAPLRAERPSFSAPATRLVGR
ncbi:MAG TPA: hypothetical protein P5234_14830 [Thermoanaerobaculaceae bacterium]|nr:hypothetical protein [Thermoanaerobaculaceae bacterium]HRS17508.1 hypothetical protein [Thermoanaerobaculaceae bacterium]